MSSKETQKNIQIVNRKAGFNFHIEERYEAGMVLLGGEVKSIRNNSVNMGDAYCVFEEGVLWVKNLHISEFRQSSYNAYDPMRNRKLLLKKQQLKRIEAKTKTKGYAIFPIRLFENERGILKLEIGLGQGKKTFDKRDDIKERDIARELQRNKM